MATMINLVTCLQPTSRSAASLARSGCIRVAPSHGGSRCAYPFASPEVRICVSHRRRYLTARVAAADRGPPVAKSVAIYRRGEVQ
jgi:hypothetical protein